MWVIIGEEWPDYYSCYCTCTCHPGCEPKREYVALFDEKEDAMEYIKKSRLKTPLRYRVFRKRSLLSYYRHAFVEFYEHENLPINPEI